MKPSGMIPIKPEDSNISLYDHQVEATQKLDEWQKQNSENPAGILVLPIGGGKTLTTTYWLMQNVLSKGKKVLWITLERPHLFKQVYHSFEKVACQDIVGDGKNSYSYRIISFMYSSAYSIDPNDDILIASTASLSVKKQAFCDWLEKNRDNFYFIIDEAHHAGAKGYRNLIKDMREHGGKFFMLGLTATPFRSDEEDFGGWLKKVFPDDILYRISISDLVNRGILSKPIFERIETNVDIRKLFEANKADYIYDRLIRDAKFDIDGVSKDAKRAAEIVAENYERNQFIVETYKKSAEKYGKTLVFALNQAMAKLLYQYFEAAGVRAGCVIVEYGSAANEETIKKFKNDELDVLINVHIVIAKDVDIPNVQTVFLTYPTKSKALMNQMIMCGLRGQKVGGTEVTYIVEFFDKWDDNLFTWVIPEKTYAAETIEGY